MTHPFDTDAGSELFSSYEAELKLVQADLNQKLDQIPDLSGEPRKAAISQAERALEEAAELLDQMRLEKSNIPSATRTKVNQRFRNHEVSERGFLHMAAHFMPGPTADSPRSLMSMYQSGNSRPSQMIALLYSAPDTQTTQMMYSLSNDNNFYPAQID